MGCVTDHLTLNSQVSTESGMCNRPLNIKQSGIIVSVKSNMLNMISLSLITENVLSYIFYVKFMKVLMPEKGKLFT